jgi:hypothetical protein
MPFMQTRQRADHCGAAQTAAAAHNVFHDRNAPQVVLREIGAVLTGALGGALLVDALLSAFHVQ